MKSVLFALIFMVSATVGFAQQESVFFDRIVQREYDQAFRFFGNELNLCIGTFEDVISQTEASSRLTDFFGKNTPKSYIIRHKGNSKGGNSSYYVLDLNTSGGLYRMFTYFDKQGNAFKISELRLEKE